MNTGVKLFLVLTLFDVCGSHHCDNSLLKPHKDGACYIVSDCNSSKNYDEHLNVIYDVDFDNGLLIANFTLPPLNFCHTEYEIQLFVNESIKDESQCLKKKPFREIHSIKNYILKKCENETTMDRSIAQHKVVVFKHIFTGCYKLKIRPRKGSSSRPLLFGNNTFIKTNYTKNFMPNISYYQHYNSQWKYLHINFSMGTNISAMKIEFNHYHDDKLVYGSPIIVKEKEEIGKKENYKCVPRSIWDSKTCAYVYESASCTFYGISPGNYSIFVAVEDDRCRSLTLWTKDQKCTWRNKIECNEDPVNSPITLSSPNINIVSAAGIAGTIILLVLFVFFICKRNRMNENDIKDGTNQETIPLKESKVVILLMYPRDCKQFMKVMDSYRKYLNSFKNVEVFDCYSEDVIEKGPFPSLLSRMSHPRLRTIIVDSQCGYIQQETMMLGTMASSRCFYKDPTFMDSIFKYGLKFIREDLSPDIYQKYYVIGFDGFSESKCELTLPTGLRRYIMPNHLEKLLADLKIDNCNEHFNMNSPEYIILREDIKSLADFKSNNPYYLENILSIT